LPLGKEKIKNQPDMSFLIYANGDSKLLRYDSKSERTALDTNTLRVPPVPFQGRGFYSKDVTPLYDDCFEDPITGQNTTQKDCFKFYQNPVSLVYEQEMRQNGTANLPDHFSRYGYNQKTSSCVNGYCLGNHNGRYIVGQNQLGKGIYDDNLPGLAPQSYYDKQEKLKKETYLFPPFP
jgi:hypothetical protein